MALHCTFWWQSIHDVVDPLLKSSVYTGNVPYSFYTLDLQAYSIVPTHYALRHGYNSAAYTMRSWQFAGESQLSQHSRLATTSTCCPPYSTVTVVSVWRVARLRAGGSHQ